MTRFVIRPGRPPPAGFNIGLTIPPKGVAVPTGPCPSIPALASWADLTSVIPCAAVAPAQASVDGGLFTAALGAGISVSYQWALDASGLTIPYACALIPDDNFEDQFRGCTVGSTYIQSNDFSTGAITSQFFMLRPNDPATFGGSYTLNCYQVSGGITVPVTFRLICTPIDPA